MDAINTSAVGGNVAVNSQSAPEVRTSGKDDFMTAFVNAVANTQSNPLTVENSDGSVSFDDVLSQIQTEENVQFGGNDEVFEGLGLFENQTNLFEGVKSTSQGVSVKDFSTENPQKMSQEMARRLITTGNARDFSAGYLGLISNSKNAVDLQSILTSVGTLKGSVAQSMGLINAIETNGISDFAGLVKEDFKDTLSAEDLLRLMSLDKNSQSSDKVVELLLRDDFGGVGKLDSKGFMALVGGFSDYSAENIINLLSGTSSIKSVLSGFSDEDDKGLFENGANDLIMNLLSQKNGLEGVKNFSATDLINSMFSNSKEEDVAIPLASVIPVEALKNLSNAQQKTQLENLETLAKALENGDAEIVRSYEYVPVKNEEEDEKSNQSILEQAQMLVGQTNFENAVREVKKDFSTDKNVSAVDAPGSFTTENMVIDDRFSAVSRIGEDDVSVADVARQTAQRISERLNVGFEQKENFSIKLNPHGLGEVEVQLEKTKDGIILNLVVSQSKTARLLNGEIQSLQNALSQYNATINEVRVEEPHQTQTESFAQNFSEEAYEQNSQSFNQSNSHKQNARNVIRQAMELERDEPAMLNNGIINTKI